MPYKDTIYALSTPYGKSGIAIIKISGPNALKTLQHLNFKKTPKERVATLGKIYNKNLEIIDEIIVIYFSKNNNFKFDGTNIKKPTELSNRSLRRPLNEPNRIQPKQQPPKI